MSFIGLRIGASGLAASQRALETSAHNVANANTDGYSRQRVSLSSAAPLLAHRSLLGPGATGQGVGIDAVTRAHDALVTSNVRETGAQVASWDTRADFFARAEQVLGPVDQGTAQALTSFWNSWEALSQSPESLTSRDQVMAAGRAIAQSLNDAHRRMTLLRNDLGSDMIATVKDVNGLSAEVAQLNGQIKAAAARGDTPNDLRDRRDQALTALARLTGAVAITEPDGDVRVSVGNMPLVDGVTADALLVTGSPPSLTWERTGSPVAAAGDLGALAELAGTGTEAIISRLDELAVELRDVVNAEHVVGFGLDGVSGRAFFSGSGAYDLALDGALVNTTVAASASGARADGNHALAMGGLRARLGSGGQTIGELLHGLQGHLGLEARHARTQRDLAQLVVDDATATLAEVSGVSVDEEMTEMLRFQRAYDASARVITVIDEMLDRLINGTGVTR